MNPLKTASPGRRTGGIKEKQDIEEFSCNPRETQELVRRFATARAAFQANATQTQDQFRKTQPHCHKCAFFELILLQGGHTRQLCHFTGAKNPIAGQTGCHFIAGEWSRIDAILGLTEGKSGNSLDFPNRDRLAGSLYHSQDDKNNGFFDLNSNSTCRIRHEYKLRHNVQYPRGLAAYHEPGSVMPFFCV